MGYAGEISVGTELFGSPRILGDMSLDFLMEDDEFQAGMVVVRPNHPGKDIQGTLLQNFHFQFQNGILGKRLMGRQTDTSPTDIDRVI
jgi:hypothetical protein